MSDIATVSGRHAEALRCAATAVDSVQAIALPIDREGHLPDRGFNLLASQDAIVHGTANCMDCRGWQFKRCVHAPRSGDLKAGELLEQRVATKARELAVQ